MQAKTLGGAGLGFCRHKLTDSIRMLARLGNLWVDFDGSIVGDRIHD